MAIKETEIKSGRDLAVYRAERGLTMRDISERSGLSTRTISRIENEQQIPNLVTLGKYARAVGIELKYIADIAKGKGTSPKLGAAAMLIS